MRTPFAEQVFGHNRPPVDEILSKDHADIPEQVNDLVGKFAGMPRRIRNDKDQAVVARLIADARDLAKDAEGRRMEAARPLNKAAKELKSWFDDQLSPLNDKRADAQRMLDDYARAKAAAERERRQREAEAARRKEEEARQKAEAAKSARSAARATHDAEAAAAEADRASTEATRGTADLVRSRSGGVMSSAQTRLAIRVTSYDEIDLNALRSYILASASGRDAIDRALRSYLKDHGRDAPPIRGVEIYEDVRAIVRR